MSGFAPHYIEPTTGWRTWALDWTGPVARLASVVGGGVWPAGVPARAECRHLPGLHPAPWSGCQRGLHATRVIEEAAYYVDLPSRSNFALAPLWSLPTPPSGTTADPIGGYVLAHAGGRRPR